jgi:hypothetical protein
MIQDTSDRRYFSSPNRVRRYGVKNRPAGSIRSRRTRKSSPDSCGWLFYDDSKGGQRRWCAMEACGTIEKMRRYRHDESDAPRRR